MKFINDYIQFGHANALGSGVNHGLCHFKHSLVTFHLNNGVAIIPSCIIHISRIFRPSNPNGDIYQAFIQDQNRRMLFGECLYLDKAVVRDFSLELTGNNKKSYI